MAQYRISDESQSFVRLFPPEIAAALVHANSRDRLVEVVLDLGRPPVARFVDRELTLLDREVSPADIEHVTQAVSGFDADNRAGVPRALHRISAIRSKRGEVVGTTCRVGRAVYGIAAIVEDLALRGRSILVVGRPGSGKTTLLRDIARILSKKRRVIVVDTSNEIGGDGNIPHQAIGRARRMQVSQPANQYEVMIEAVENHNPEAIIIDEIGREAETHAARTIAERGVQLVATAHGGDLEGVLKNPVVSDLIGGLQTVVLSDEEARRRGTQKTVSERRYTPSFDVVVEIQGRNSFFIYEDVAAAVDAILQGTPLSPEHRSWNERGEIVKEKGGTPDTSMAATLTNRNGQAAKRGDGSWIEKARTAVYPTRQLRIVSEIVPATIRLFPLGVSRRLLYKAIRAAEAPIHVVREVEEADVVLTLRDLFHKSDPCLVYAEQENIPVHVVKTNAQGQIEAAIANLLQ